MKQTSGKIERIGEKIAECKGKIELIEELVKKSLISTETYIEYLKLIELELKIVGIENKYLREEIS